MSNLINSTVLQMNDFPGHAGRPGQVGGSVPRGGVGSVGKSSSGGSASDKTMKKYGIKSKTSKEAIKELKSMGGQISDGRTPEGTAVGKLSRTHGPESGHIPDIDIAWDGEIMSKAADRISKLRTKEDLQKYKDNFAKKQRKITDDDIKDMEISPSKGMGKLMKEATEEVISIVSRVADMKIDELGK